MKSNVSPGPCPPLASPPIFFASGYARSRPRRSSDESKVYGSGSSTPTPLPEGAESFTITRNVDLSFTPADPQGLQLAGWGDTQVGGTYAESITGLHRETLFVAGTFRLQHVSRVAVLDDGL